MTSSIILGARLWPEAEVAEQRADGGGNERARQRRRPEGVGEAAPQHDGEEPSRNEGTAERPRGACDDRTVTKYKKKQAAGTQRVMVES